MGRKKWKKSIPIEEGGDRGWVEESDTYIVDDQHSEWLLEEEMRRDEQLERDLEDEVD